MNAFSTLPRGGTTVHNNVNVTSGHQLKKQEQKGSFDTPITTEKHDHHTKSRFGPKIQNYRLRAETSNFPKVI